MSQSHNGLDMQENSQLKRLKINSLLSIVGLLLLLLITINTYEQKNHLGIPELWSGYSLFAIIILLVLFNLRKRLSMLPLLGSAYAWHQLHIVAGFISIALYALHVDSWWPPAGYERWIAGCFYLAISSGVLGLLIQIYYPKRLSEIGDEIIFERIPDAIVEIRNTAINHVQECVKETKSETLLRLYSESLDQYFRRPHFILQHIIGSQSAEFWLKKRFASVRHFCSTKELQQLETLQSLALTKNRVDQQYAYQWLMKIWLFIHIPCVLALLIFVLWHFLLVNIYAL